MTKVTTVKELGAMLTHIVAHMATKEDLDRMANEADIAKLRSDLQDRLDDLGLKLGNQLAGLERRLDVDAMRRSEQRLPERVRAIEQGLDHKVS